VFVDTTRNGFVFKIYSFICHGHLQIVKEGMGCLADKNSPAVPVTKVLNCFNCCV